MTTKKRVAIYLRVSTDGQTAENQRLELERVAELSGWELVGVYEDHGISGAKGRDQRPAFDRLMKDAARRKFNMIAAWGLDRLGRSMQHLVGFLGEVQALGVDLYLHQQALDTSTPMGRCVFHVAGAFAEFEREMIRERVKAGLSRAKAKGKQLGRKTVGADKEELVKSLLGQGKGILKVAKEAGVGVSVVQRIKALA
ncbi:recombinase family protein [Dongia soli]|uniref:Recombinase family protein n=1 Tax=Dongia soli TaxID=600628 RepID=A0ABU5EFL6_9PROT|nr:recombinase family protein [Dongia soli]MDY0884315.1 recombinase family protein [Dongia soli]